MSFIYPPARHEPLVEPTASMSQLIRQFFVFLSTTNAPPRPNPFCGGMLPAAMCSGWSVKNSIAHPGAVLKPQSLQASLTRSPFAAKVRLQPVFLSRARAAPSQGTRAPTNPNAYCPRKSVLAARKLRRLCLSARLRLGLFLRLSSVRSSAFHRPSSATAAISITRFALRPPASPASPPRLHALRGSPPSPCRMYFAASPSVLTALM